MVKTGKFQAVDFFANSERNAHVEDELAATQDRLAAIEAENRRLETLMGAHLASGRSKEMTVSIHDIVRDPNQVRRWFDPVKLADLTVTIRSVGFRGRLWVRPLAEGKYQLIAGERRLRAAVDAGLTELPVDILDVNDELALTLSLLENLQREDLNPVEEAEGILQLLAQRLRIEVDEVPSVLYRLKHYREEGIGGNVSPTEEFEIIESVFQMLGRISWQTFIRTRLSLRKLPQELLNALQQGKIEYTKAQVIAQVKNEKDRLDLLEEAVRRNLPLLTIQAKVQALKQLAPKPHSMRNQFKEILKIRSKGWDDPKKAKKIQSLLEQLQALVSD